MASNQTHSSCACSHLSTFGLLSAGRSRVRSPGEQDEGEEAAAADESTSVGRPQFGLQALRTSPTGGRRLPLESLDSELHLSAAGRTLYLAKVSGVRFKLEEA